MSAVAAFVEKPDATTAQRYISEGYLWNSGNFIVQSKVLVQEIADRAAAVAEAVEGALKSAVQDDAYILLGSEFKLAPKISIDYAVMEKTSLAAVLPVRFAWTDLGAWDSVHASGEGNVGLHVWRTQRAV